MVAQLTRGERQLAIVVLTLVALVGLAMAAAGRADPIGAHGVIVMVACVGLIFVVLASFYAPEPSPERLDHYYDDPSKVGIVLSMAWAVVGMFLGVWVAALLAWPDLTFDAAWASFGRLRPAHTSAVIFGFGGNALIATSFHVLQRTSRARLPDQFTPWFVLLGYNLFCVVAAAGYFMGVTQSKEYAEPEWYADIWLVIVWVTYFAHLYPHAGAAEGTAHLRRQLVLHGVHPGCRDPAHREQSCRPGVVGTCQELFRLLGRPGRDDPVVVRPQRGGLLPDCRVPRHDVLLPAEACRAADLFVQAFHHQLLGHHLHVHVGRFPPPALHGPAAMGSDARHDLLAGPAGTLLGFGRKRARYAQRRLAQGSRRRDASLHDGGGGVLWTEHVRRVVPGDPRGQLAVALHGLDHRTRPRWRVGLGRIDHVRLDLLCRSLALETRAHVFGKAGGSPLLVGHFRDRHLRLRDVEFRHHPGADVADLQRERDADLFLHRVRWSRCIPITSRALSAGCCS